VQGNKVCLSNVEEMGGEAELLDVTLSIVVIKQQHDSSLFV